VEGVEGSGDSRRLQGGGGKLRLVGTERGVYHNPTTNAQNRQRGGPKRRGMGFGTKGRESRGGMGKGRSPFFGQEHLSGTAHLQRMKRECSVYGWEEKGKSPGQNAKHHLVALKERESGPLRPGGRWPAFLANEHKGERVEKKEEIRNSRDRLFFSSREKESHREDKGGIRKRNGS